MKIGYFEYMSLTYPFSPLDALSRGRILASPERVLALKDGPGAMLGGRLMLALTWSWDFRHTDCSFCKEAGVVGIV